MVEFLKFLPKTEPIVKEALIKGSETTPFFPTVLKRGLCLHNGAYTLQLRVQKEKPEVWTVKHTVGASYSYQIHVGYFQISAKKAVLRQICDCYSGYVMMTQLCVKLTHSADKSLFFSQGSGVLAPQLCSKAAGRHVRSS